MNVPRRSFILALRSISDSVGREMGVASSLPLAMARLRQQSGVRRVGCDSEARQITLTIERGGLSLGDAVRLIEDVGVCVSSVAPMKRIRAAAVAGA